MTDSNQVKTTILATCEQCSSQLYGLTRFCRFCGARQADYIHEASAAYSGDLQTKTLQLNDNYRPVSGPLIDAVGTGFGASRALHLRGGVARTLLFALISIPVWLLIVLLSPIDACLAARAIASNQ